MAFKLGRKLGKLDAICANLKLKTQEKGLSEDVADGREDLEDVSEAKSLTNGSPTPAADAPADLSIRSNNNNVIGKADLNSVEDETNEEDQVLDFTVKTNREFKAAETANVKDYTNDRFDHVETELSKKHKLNEQASFDRELEFDDDGELDDEDIKCDNDDNREKSSFELKHMVDAMREMRKAKVPPVTTNRRKSRKSTVPRSITQVRDYYDHLGDKDELAEYEINNQNTNFPPDDCEDMEKDSEQDLGDSGRGSLSESRTSDIRESPEHQSDSHHHFAQSRPSVISSAPSAFAPLDLSVNKNKVDSDDSDDDIDDENAGHVDMDSSSSRNLVNQDGSRLALPLGSQALGPLGAISMGPGSKHINSDQVNHLKDFAESTMNELISMYGFGGLHPGDHSKLLPMQNNFKHISPHNLSPSPQERLSPGNQSVGGASVHNQPMSSGEEDLDRSTPNKGIYASYGKSGPTVMNKQPGNPKLQNDRFTTSSSFINAVYNKTASSPTHLSPALPNYSKYLKRYNNGCECGGQHCRDLGYREHYHCIDCSFQVFVKKEEMVRHYKWHRKREESLQHGFLRFSPMDNCTKRFGNCTHNGKQTHYHCLQRGCDKVYISTSDVQMHANYHRKDSAIMSEGFQRFRATEDCGTLACTFYGQRTTHFHCLRPDCNFTFKNKADMEKHKSYHQKDESLGRDGFKKFMKYEHCNFAGCRYSKVSNHIHCIRSGCDYVLHSTAQLYSHKRKHERRDFESAYKKYRNHSTPAPNPNKVPILPRPDYIVPQPHLNLGQNLGQGGLGQGGLGPSPLLHQTLANLSGMKRVAEWDQTEPLELKKPKLEHGSDVDMSAPSTPSACSTPVDKVGIKMEPEDSMDADDSNAEDVKDASPAEKGRIGLVGLNDNVDLSGSLNLPIPRFVSKPGDSPTASNPGPLDLQKPLFSPLPAENILSSLQNFASLCNSMPSTLTGSLVSMNPGMLLTVPSSVAGASTVLQPPKSVYTERREKDDSWKNYLVRYTANDPCNPRCQYLYKDHYHCKMDGCLVLFKSKDGVREHARFHELQDRITPIAYQTFEDKQACPDKCQYSEKEKHYHCKWTDCTHVIPYVGPTFGRLEHYRIHEYTRAAAGKSYHRSPGRAITTLEDTSIRRRGRPPKYPKIDLPKIPKVELSEEEIQQSQLSSGLSDSGNAKVVNGFRVFSYDDPCPDDRCNYAGKLHYHCARQRCFTVTDRIDVLNLHAKDFHSFVKILDGYEFYDRAVNCRRMYCPNNQSSRHFHCTRSKCDYSFIRHSTMAQHEKKHQHGGASITMDTPMSPKHFQKIPILPLPGNSPETALPLTHRGLPPNSSQGLPIFISQPDGSQVALSQGSVMIPPQVFGLPDVPGAPLAVAMSSTPGSLSAVQALPASVSSGHLMAGLPAPLVTMGGLPVSMGTLESASIGNPNVPLTVLLQRGINQIPQPTWTELKAKMHYTIAQNCGRPFCKLKKKDHYHCFDCNQAFSDPARLRSHVGKHGIKLKRSDNTDLTPKAGQQNTDTGPLRNLTPKSTAALDMDPDEAQCLAEAGNMADNSDGNDDDEKSSSLNLNPSMFSQMIFKAQEQNKMGSDIDSDCNDDENDLKIDTGSETNSVSDLNEHVDLSRSGRKNTKAKHEGFMNSGDIGGMGKRQSAVRNGGRPATGNLCGMSNSSMVPDGYSRWRYNEDCQYPKCAYKHSVTHFHCVRDDCGYGFSDRSRLVQHSLRHERIDSITGGELQQYRINQDCEIGGCEFNKKMSHFHCKRCDYSCTDSSKVLTHRKYHAKMDNIVNQGFEKFLAADDCGVNVCPYSRKQNHFHCLLETCRAAVLGHTQMSTHKQRHDMEKDA